MKKNYLILLGITLALLSFSPLLAQRACGTMQHLEEQKMLDPDLEQRMQQVEIQTRNWIIQQQKLGNTIQSVITIPVVVHVLYNTTAQNISDAQVQSQIDVLNEDFRKLNTDVSQTPSAFAGLAADCQINFCLAQRDPNGIATNGIIHKYTSTTSFGTNDNVKRTANGGDDAWNTTQYLNLWSCNLGSSLLGYAQFPGGTASTDGVVILYSAFGRVGTVNAPYNLGRTATHEVGHWLNLRHIWGDSNCGNDQVTDTPTQQTSNYGCPNFPHTTCSNGANGDMFMNYMDYTDDPCMYMFTTGQSSRMAAAVNASRSGLLTSQGCVPPATGGTTCAIPSGLSASAITSNSATIFWGGVSGASSYNVEYRLSGAASWTSTSTASTSLALSSLTAASTYEYQVQTVCSTGNSNFSATATFNTSAVATSCSDIYEANNSTSTAKIVSVNTDLYAVIGTSTDNDYYKFTTVTGATNIKVVLDQLTLDYDLKLLKSNGATISTSQLGGSSSETIIRNTTNAATYYARVYGYGGAFSTSNCYHLRINASGSTFRGDGSTDGTYGNIVAQKITGLDAVNVFPNPADGALQLNFFNAKQNTVKADIIDMLGKVVYSHSMFAEEGFQETSLRTNELPAGIYMLRVKAGSDTVTKRFVVRH